MKVSKTSFCITLLHHPQQGYLLRPNYTSIRVFEGFAAAHESQRWSLPDRGIRSHSWVVARPSNGPSQMTECAPVAHNWPNACTEMATRMQTGELLYSRDVKFRLTRMLRYWERSYGLGVNCNLVWVKV